MLRALSLLLVLTAATGCRLTCSPLGNPDHPERYVPNSERVWGAEGCCSCSTSIEFSEKVLADNAAQELLRAEGNAKSAE